MVLQKWNSEVANMRIKVKDFLDTLQFHISRDESDIMRKLIEEYKKWG